MTTSHRVAQAQYIVLYVDERNCAAYFINQVYVGIKGILHNNKLIITIHFP